MVRLDMHVDLLGGPDGLMAEHVGRRKQTEAAGDFRGDRMPEGMGPRYLDVFAPKAVEMAAGNDAVEPCSGSNLACLPLDKEIRQSPAHRHQCPALPASLFGHGRVFEIYDLASEVHTVPG